MTEFLYLSLGCLCAALFMLWRRPRPACFELYPHGSRVQQQVRGCDVCHLREICISQTKPMCYGTFDYPDMIDRECWACPWTGDCREATAPEGRAT